MIKLYTLVRGLLFSCTLYLSSFSHPIKRQSDLFSKNNFYANLVTNSKTNVDRDRSALPSTENSNIVLRGSHSYGEPGRGSYSGQSGDPMGTGLNPFNTDNRAGKLKGLFLGISAGSTFSSGATGDSGPFASGANEISAGPFDSGANGNSAGHFSSSAKGSSAGRFSTGANGNSAGPFSGGAKGNIGPFSGYSKNDGGKTPFPVSKGNAIDFSRLFPLDQKLSTGGMNGPFENSNMKGGPGGLTGGLFDMGSNDGPGGLNGGPFISNKAENVGPGGLTGGNFLDNTDSEVDSKFDTSEYEKELKEMFSTDSTSSRGDGNPFDPDSYSTEINNAGTGRTRLSSGGAKQYRQYHKTVNHYNSYSPGNSNPSFRHGNTDINNSYKTPFNENTNFNELLSTPFESNQINGLQRGRGYNDQSIGTQYSPFKADHGLTGMAAMNNPGGNPFSQAGSMLGRG